MTFKESDKTLIITLGNRIDSANARQAEEEIFAAVDEFTGEVQIDACNLEFISSAGLRVLMNLRKHMDRQLTVLNVSRDVYDVFEMTGFTNILDIKRALREISVEGLEVIGSGGYGTVYRLDEETIVKVYRPGIGLDFIDGEREASKTAFVLGIPTAIPYDTVKVGDQFGVVYEMVEAKTVAQLVEEDPSRLHELGVLSAKALKEFHQIKPLPGDFPRHKDKYQELIEKLTVYLTPEEKQRLQDFLDSIPDSDVFIHGDYNPKNIMVKDGEIILIDIGAASVGHPIFDLAGLLLVYLYLPHARRSAESVKHLLGFDLELAGDMWKSMISTYYDTKDEKEIKKIEDMLWPVVTLNILFQGFTRGVVTEEEARKKIDMYVRETLFKQLNVA